MNTPLAGKQGYARSAMGRLEDLSKGARVTGIAPVGVVTVIDTEWIGADAVNLTYEDEDGNVRREIVYRSKEAEISPDIDSQPWLFDADPDLFTMVAEAKRISLAHLFDPYLATYTSDVDPLPHQIEAVYKEMLPRRPLRFLLADDPGAGKTIMAGLFIKELIVRGDLERCLIVVPGGLAEQWQDELGEKFGLDFELLTRAMVEATRSGNPLAERPLLIARLDMLARDDKLQDQLDRTDWDLVVVDEAHKMSATFRGDDIQQTKRYKLGRHLEAVARHFLLMSATPHNGKPEDFQLFMALLDDDIFAGKYRRGTHSDKPAKDLMRRRIKEDLLRFDGTRLFPEREATTAKYTLSPAEHDLYEHVTEYVRNGMNRAEQLKKQGDGRRSAVVGFALTILQRRLASSPRAILRSLERRRDRLSARLAEAENARPDTSDTNRSFDHDTASHHIDMLGQVPQGYHPADFDEFDPDELLASEQENFEQQIEVEATSARTIPELKAEINELNDLVQRAQALYQRGDDRKWDELSNLLQNTPEMLDESGRTKKLIIFTEHRDTLDYLVEKLSRLRGQTDEIVKIDGSVRREDRRRAQDQFTQNDHVRILVATDAAGEGLNLQRAHLMVNYDLPWNPNRIEQRFGRIHRIGQTEVCRLWNLVAENTREGQVFERLLEKLNEQRQALGGKVFDVLGEAFSDKSLRELLIEAITAEEPATQQLRMAAVLDATVGERTRELIQEQSLLTDELGDAVIAGIREQMERAQAMRLQPSFIRQFFLGAFSLLNGKITKREAERYQISRVPQTLRHWDTTHGRGRLLPNYERICFERAQIAVPGRPLADLVSPGHALLDATIGALLERHGSVLQQGCILIDPTSAAEAPRVLVLLEHEIVDGTTISGRQRRVISKQFEYVEITADGEVADAGEHPYLDCRSPEAYELQLLMPLTTADWIRETLSTTALNHAVEHNVPSHVSEVEARIHSQVDRTLEAVRQRLKEEINHWYTRALRLKDDELAGKPNAQINSAKARQRAEEAELRLNRREEELARQRKLAPLRPRIVGAAFIIPERLLATLVGTPPPENPIDTTRTDRLAVDAVLATERSLGREPVEMPHNNKGFDIEARGSDGGLFTIEVKGRVAGARDFTITRSEIICALNKAHRHILALVEVADNDSTDVRYLYDPFTNREPEPSSAEYKRTLDWQTYRNLAEPPR
ncbi:MAG: helicase-related protein [bacterium]|nr:helicase-related protein [bacterium]